MNLSSHSGPGPPLLKVSSDRHYVGSSCKALRTAVSALYSVDDFIKDKIGSGFFSEVYKVTHRTTGQVMVLKMNQLRSNRPNMLREVQLLNKLSHPNILRFMGVCVHEGQLHALTEYINSGSLEQLIQNKLEILNPAMKLRLTLGIAKGMQYVHECGVFHRDLTSKNVLIRKSKDGYMDSVVGDFGLAAKIPRKCGKSRLDTVGSPYWISPECLKGLWYDQTSDVFSYGIISCELIARIDADPDILPRTDSFGLDYLAFVDLCPNDTPPAFLRLSFDCCTYDSKSRPNFSEIVTKILQILDKITDDNLEKKNNLIVPSNSQNINNNSCFQINNKRNSIDANIVIPLYIEDDDSILQLQNINANGHTNVQHRRSLSENVIFPSHTTPSDKARCHIMNRSNKIHDEGYNTEFATSSNITLRKVAETMFLKDPNYKPRLGDHVPKSNPFTVLTQLKGVKKILGANPTTYTSGGVGDLFSSCFEMSSPFLRQLCLEKPTINSVQPKSLPNSPTSSRKDFKFKRPNDNLCKTKHINVDGYVKVSASTIIESTDDDDLYNCNAEQDIQIQPNTGTIKKYKANSLFSHPLFKSGQFENEIKLNDCFDDFILPEPNRSDSIETVCYENSKILNRRGSTESGFFSCLNEDFNNFRSTCCCCLDDIKTSFYNLESADKIPVCRCSQFSNHKRNDLELSNQTLNDSSSILMLDDAVSSLRSLDDLDLSESKNRKRLNCRHNLLGNVDIDARSIDMGLINRLALDTEINNFIQKSQFSNQLLYCKNRTSSIYTDSSDDISSLAGSDSLLWDERSFTTIPNTRSAQIAKIVEYFERKGQSFKPFTVPDSLKSSPTSRQHNNFSECFLDVRRGHGGVRKLTEFKNKSNEYETFCLELDKKPTQRLMVCDGAVRSKLPIFDKQKRSLHKE